MGVDLNKVKKMAEEEAQREAARATGGIRWWTPKQGRNNIRLLPPWTDQGVNANTFAREVHTHWGVGDGDNKRIFTCPLRTPGLGDPCPICEEVDHLRATNDPLDAENANNIRAKQGYISNIIDLDDAVFTKEDYESVVAGGKEPGFDIGDTKVQVFRYGPMIYKDLLNTFVLLSMDLTDLQTGRDLIINKSGKGKNGTKYTVVIGPVATPVVAVGGAIKDKLVNLDAVGLPKTYAEMQQALTGGPPAPAGLPPVKTAPSLPARSKTAPPAAAVMTSGDALEQEMLDALKQGA